MVTTPSSADVLDEDAVTHIIHQLTRTDLGAAASVSKCWTAAVDARLATLCLPHFGIGGDAAQYRRLALLELSQPRTLIEARATLWLLTQNHSRRSPYRTDDILTMRPPDPVTVAPAVGCSVELRSLAARPELNGRRAFVVAPLEPRTGRLAVMVDGVAEPLALRPANLVAARLLVVATPHDATPPARRWQETVLVWDLPALCAGAFASYGGYGSRLGRAGANSEEARHVSEQLMAMAAAQRRRHVYELTDDTNPGRVHPGVRCVRSRMNPIVGTRYTIPIPDIPGYPPRNKTYDICQAEYDKMGSEDQAKYTAIEPSTSMHETQRRFRLPLDGLHSWLSRAMGPDREDGRRLTPEEEARFSANYRDVIESSPLSCLLVSRADGKCVPIKKRPGRSVAAQEVTTAPHGGDHGQIDLSCEPAERREHWSSTGWRDCFTDMRTGRTNKDREGRWYEFEARFGPMEAAPSRSFPQVVACIDVVPPALAKRSDCREELHFLLRRIADPKSRYSNPEALGTLREQEELLSALPWQ